jgi:rare lipoprotein A
MSFGASATQLGLASYYGATGLTAAHRSLPMGSRVKVINLANGRSVVLRIMDRGPFIRGRIIDVSTAAAEALGFRSAGLAHVKIEALSPEPQEPGPRPEPQQATLEASSYDICRYGAERVQHEQSDWLGGEAVAMRSDTGCENLRWRSFGLAERSEDLAPFAAADGALTGADAAISIPVSAIAEAEAASIPVGALPPVPKNEAPPTRAAPDCGAASSCEKAKQLPASNSVTPLVTLFRHIFD